MRCESCISDRRRTRINADEINSLESESGVIASLIQNPELYYHSENLLPNHFSSFKNQAVYAAIGGLVTSGVTVIDPYNIMTFLESSDKTKKFADRLTVDGLQELVDLSVLIARGSVEEYKLLVKNVLDAAFRRDMYIALEACLKSLSTSDDNEDMRREIYRAIDDTVAAYSYGEEIKPYAEVVDTMWKEIQERQGGQYAGLPFKFQALNEYVTAEKGELIIFGAQQKVGKSIMLLNIAVDFLRQGKSVIYIDSELSTRLFTARLLSHLSGLSYNRLTSGRYSVEEGETIDEMRAWIKTQKFTHIYMPFFDQESIYTAVKQVDNRQKLDVIIIDYFKSTGNELDAFQTYASMGRCVDMVKNEIAGSMNIIAIGAAQATATGKLADSAKIARNASTIIMLVDKTPEEIEADGPECGNKKMIVAVNRNGRQMSPGEYIDLKFDGDHILYEQAQQHTPAVPF